MKKNYILSLVFYFFCFYGFSQTTETENFDSCSNCTQEFDLSSEATPSGFWNGSDDDSSEYGWEIKNGETSSSSTGPSAAYNGSYYAYCETSAGGSDKTFILESDTYNATSTTMSFYYHMYGATIGNLYVDESTNGGTSWNTLLTISGQQQTDELDSWVQVTSGSGSFSAISSSTNKLRIRYVSGSSYTGDAAIDQIVVTYQSGPSISVGSAITGLNYASGSGPSTSQSTTVSGSSLEADITLSAPTNYEISTDNSSFADSATLSHSGGTVNSTTIYARLKSGLSINSYSGNITASSTNATSKTIALSGTVYNGENSSWNYYVDDSGNNSNNGLTDSAPWATLAYAISQAVDGTATIVNVGAGTYTEHSINVSKSSLTIKGAGSSSTIFDASTSDEFMWITASSVTIEGMKIKDYVSAGATSNAYGGAAIRVGAAPGTQSTSSSLSSITIKDVYFEDNITTATGGDGGAIHINDTDSGATIAVTISGCTFDGNQTTSTSSYAHGGAIALNSGCTLTIENSVFFDNIAKKAGGAIAMYAGDTGTMTVNNSTFYNNVGQNYSSYSHGDAQIVVSESNATAYINNCILYDSDISDGTHDDVSSRSSATVTIRNSIVERDQTYNSGTISESSVLTSDPNWTDAASDDFTLQSGSPAIDTGSSTYAPADDINDLTRPQGQADDMGAYEHANTWTGSSSTAWATAANWSENIVPVSGRSPVIADVANDPDISTAVTLEDLTLQSGASLDITSTGSLTLTDDFTNNSGTLTISSGGSLIVNGTASGTITYTRTLGSANWYLVASPVVGQLIDDSWADANGIASSGSNRAIGAYVTSNDTWLYAQSGQSGVTFESGLGYAIKRTSPGNISVTGTINTDNETETLTTTGNGFNLLGNPYPSYINSGSILSANSSSLDQQTIWLWNQATASYDTKVADDAFKIAPGQGFFVKSDGASGNVSILESYQSHQSDTFQGPIMASPEIYLTLTDDSNTRYTRIKYNENATTGFDNGYDGEMFGATSNAFAIYTHLVGNEQGQVGNSQGHGYAVQSLPTDNYENMIVPVGINATRGTTINIEATLNNFPEGVNVYLADKQENSVTLLETNTSYSTTLEEDLNGVGRFYIHTTPNALSSGEVMDSIPLSIYTSDRETLTIEGVATGTAYVQLYTMLGEELLQTSFEGTGVNKVLLPNLLNPGIYIVRIATATGVTSKKIMIN